MNWMAKSAMVAKTARMGVLSRAMVVGVVVSRIGEMIVSEETGGTSEELWSLVGQEVIPYVSSLIDSSCLYTGNVCRRIGSSRKKVNRQTCM